MMGKDARNEDLDLTPALQSQFDEFVSHLARGRYGEEGPPRETTFAQIEAFGHQAGRMLARAVDSHLAAQHAAQFANGALVLEKIGDVAITGRGLNKNAVKIATEMVQQRDVRTAAYFDAPLPRRHAQPSTPIDLACVSIDGGRMQTRDEGAGSGVHHPHWRESKNALFLRMQSDVFAGDPHPALPACYADRGRMMEVEADARGFYHALKKAFVCDGLPYNWTIQQRHFRDFTPILDFVHAVERLYEAARSVHADEDCRWNDYLRWAQACWSGDVHEVLAELKQHQSTVGLPPPDGEKTDPRKLLADAIGYFQNNAARMQYPQYRQAGLPMTSALMESLVKEVNARVKGTEKFWNDGPSGEAILQLRAAVLCDDDRLNKFLQNRPGHPFHPNVPRKPELATAT